MKSITAVFSAIALVASVAAIAGPGKKPAKVTAVWTCPMMGSAIKDHNAKGVTYKNKTGTYDVHFCCAGCPEEFAKLSPKEKDAKIAAIVKKEAPKKKG